MAKDTFFRRFFPTDPKATTGFQDAVLACLPDHGAILDLGCGKNTLLAPYRTDHRCVWGADLQEHPALEHRDWFRLLEAGGKIPFADGTFDLVTTCWVLEHIEQPVPFLQEVSRILRPGGAFISLSVSGRHYVTWLTRLMGLLPHRLTQTLVHNLYGRQHHDTFPTFYRLNTPGQLQKSARAAGLEATTLLRVANPGYFAFFRPLQRLAIVTDWLLDKVCPGLGRIFFISTLIKPDLKGQILSHQAA